MGSVDAKTRSRKSRATVPLTFFDGLVVAAQIFVNRCLVPGSYTTLSQLLFPGKEQQIRKQGLGFLRKRPSGGKPLERFSHRPEFR
jgi:hypothetical protein